jgi:hypothetical protein
LALAQTGQQARREERGKKQARALWRWSRAAISAWSSNSKPAPVPAPEEEGEEEEDEEAE